MIMKKFKIINFGCKVNEYEGAKLSRAFVAGGHSLSNFAPDVVIVNTCVVTESGARKSANMVRKTGLRYGGAVLILTGCMVSAFPDMAANAGADFVYTFDELLSCINSGDIEYLSISKARISALQSAAAQAESAAAQAEYDHDAQAEYDPDAQSGPQSEHDPAQSGQQSRHVHAAPYPRKTRATLLIQTGCDGGCAYCVIPRARGRAKSRDFNDILHEAGQLSRDYNEIVIIGINIAAYECDGKDLADVVSAMAAFVPRVRLSSIEPDLLTEDMIRRFAIVPQLCAFFHLSLQSGCDKTLRNMHRKYDTASIRRQVELLRELFPGCGVAADLIVGFPSETEADFLETRRFVKELRFTRLHVFPFSRREGTAAYTYANQIYDCEKERRSRVMRAAAVELMTEFETAKIGEVVEVLFEKTPKSYGGLLFGHTREYIRVVVDSALAARGDIRRVRITESQNGADFGGYAVVGEVCRGELVD